MGRWRVGDVIGAVIFGLLAGARLRQVLAGEVALVVLVAQAGLAAFLMLARRPEKITASLSQRLTAWGAVLLPFGLQIADVPPAALWLSVLGVAFSVWGLVSLGRSFGIAPADRGLVTRGAYRVVRHPMYLGEMASYLALGLARVSLWNVLLLVLILGLFVVRIRWEEALIAGYETYRSQVRWRLLPGVW